MSYVPSTDFIALWRNQSGGAMKAEMPALDFVVAALARAGLINVSFSATPPVVNQATTMWFRTVSPTYAGEGTLYLWNGTAYVPATPGLWQSSGGGGGGTATVSPVAPANPAVGQQWWDGTTMRVWDGFAWKVVGGGIGSSASDIPFALTQTTDLTLTSTVAYEVVPYADTPQIVPGAAVWDAATRKLTPKKAGMYMFQLKIVPVGNNGFAILKNDDGFYDAGSNTNDIIVAAGTDPNGQHWHTLLGMAYMNGTTDFVRVWAASTAARLMETGTASPAFSALYLP